MQVKPGDCYFIKYYDNVQTYFIVKPLLKHEKCILFINANTLTFYSNYWFNIPMTIQHIYTKIFKL